VRVAEDQVLKLVGGCVRWTLDGSWFEGLDVEVYGIEPAGAARTARKSWQR